MKRALAATIATIAALAIAAPLAHPVGATAAPFSKHTKTAHVAFEGCPARTTLLTVTLLNLTYSPTQPILIGLIVRNESGRACGQDRHSDNPLAKLGLSVGPCGNVSLVIDDVQNREVFPGSGNIPPCAAPFSARLAAHHSLTTVAVWSQERGLHGQMQVSPGRYRIIIDSKIVFTVTLTGSGGPSSPGTTHPPLQPPPSGPCGSFFNLVANQPTSPTTTTTRHHKCPIDQVAPPLPGSTPTPTVPPSTSTTTTTTALPT